MTAFVQTVTGRIPASALGKTLMHEHILCDLRDPARRHLWEAGPEITIENRFQIDYFQNENQRNMRFDDDAVAARELRKFREAGGGTIVEVSSVGLKPQPDRLAAIARESGVNIVLGGGFYIDSYLPPEIARADIGEMEAIIRAQLAKGVGTGGVRCGLIGEIGCSWPLEPSERRSLVAAARVQAATGVAITIHPGRDPDAPAEIADVIEGAGGDPTRTVIGHMDRTIFDRQRLLDLLHRGFVLEWDFFGAETSQYWMKDSAIDLPLDYMRLDLIHELFGLGFRERVTVSHDICSLTRLTAYGGHGYAHLPLNVVPIMRRRGWSEADIEQLLVATPARLLGYLSAA